MLKEQNSLCGIHSKSKCVGGNEESGSAEWKASDPCYEVAKYLVTLSPNVPLKANHIPKRTEKRKKKEPKC